METVVGTREMVIGTTETVVGTTETAVGTMETVVGTAETVDGTGGVVVSGILCKRRWRFRFSFLTGTFSPSPLEKAG